MCNEKIITNQYKSPIDFMKDYIDLLSNQIESPKKVYFNEIGYSSVYEHALFNHVIEIIQVDDPNLNELKKIEDLLVKCYNLKYYDVVFYKASVLQYTKGIAILLDRLDTEIKSGKFDNVGLLYHFCGSKLDLFLTLINYVKRKFCFDELLNDKKQLNFSKDDIQAWRDISDTIIIINTTLSVEQQSFLASSPELKKRYTPSDILIGIKRVTKYKLGKCLIAIIEGMPGELEDKYNLVMKFISEFSIENVGNDEDRLIMKNFSTSLIS